MAFNLGKMSY
ncbi:hypothetical protein F383_00169 [Gossypium arboreum]|uniref:Uncharacterized protein n=1 Tax=Gossypium arboreum TaxID=29729 RepID=A0A0B0NUE6_GOSAR|nr:hypothetical protein F383_21912 [Gossypium arboreum]KHG21046.1 hypothetical protein F383_26720 [Gossypium arboreum]KHG21432.1 hypothetical protein F383_00169 [Gossypium arboreum]